MSALPSRTALVAGAALLSGAILAPIGVSWLRRAQAESPPAAPAAPAAPAQAGVAAAAAEVAGLADAGAGRPGERSATGSGAVDGLPGLTAGAGLPRFESPVWSPASRAAKYGSLSSDACGRELQRRKIPHTPARGAPLVDRPVRIAGPLHGVTFRGDGVAKARTTSIFDIADCRLVLVLDDLAALLSARGVIEVVHVSMHRPAPAGAPPPKKAASATQRAPGKAQSHRAAKRPAPGGRAATKPRTSKAAAAPKKPAAAPKKPAAAPKKPSQHALGLAIDVAAFVKADGSRLDVEADWHGTLGAPPCGPGSEPKERTPHALELRELACAVYESGLFNVVLTPNANEQHADHFHFDIKRDARYFLLE